MPRSGPGTSLSPNTVHGPLYGQIWSSDIFKPRHGPGTFLWPEMVQGPIYAQIWSLDPPPLYVQMKTGLLGGGGNCFVFLFLFIRFL